MKTPALALRALSLVLVCAFAASSADSAHGRALAAGDSVSSLPQDPPPPDNPVTIGSGPIFPTRITFPLGEPAGAVPLPESPIQRLSMPSPIINFDGLDKATYSTANPPHVDGAVSPDFYVQAVNAYYGVFNKADGSLFPLASQSIDDLWFLTGEIQTDPCVKLADPAPSYHIGDPLVLFDHVYQRWIIADVAAQDYSSGPFSACIAVSASSVPSSWIRWNIPIGDPWFPDELQLAFWPDGIYMSADMFDCDSTPSTCGTPTYVGNRVWALHSAPMYSSQPLAPEDIQYFTTTTSYHDLLPSVLLGVAPPSGTPNYFASKDLSSNNIDVWKFHVDWTTPANSTFNGPSQVAISAYTAPPATIPQKTGEGGELLDSQGDRLMPHNYFRKIGATESLWLSHTVGNGSSAGVRWYQLDVASGTIASSPVQSGTFFGDPSADGLHRWVPSLAVDTDGGTAIGYSTSGTTIFPEIRYAGRLAGDTLGSLAQGESTLLAGTGVQNGASGTWGPHSSMSIDPSDDCTFWYTNMYYDAADTTTANWTTRIANFKFPGCLADIINIAGNTVLPNVALGYNNGGPQTATSDGNGDYSFYVPSSWSGEVTPLLTHYFFDPPSREYTAIASHQTGQDYTPHPYVLFAPDNASTVCRMPWIVVKLFLSDLTRTAGGALDASTVTFKLDGGNILNLSTIRVPPVSPNAWADFVYKPSSNLNLGSHTAQFTHPEVSGTVTDTWTFTAANNITCTPPALLAAPADSQIVQSPPPSPTAAPASAGTGTRSSLLVPAGPTSSSANPSPATSALGVDDAALSDDAAPSAALIPQAPAPSQGVAPAASPPLPSLLAAPEAVANPPYFDPAALGFGPLRLPLHPGWALVYYFRAH